MNDWCAMCGKLDCRCFTVERPVVGSINFAYADLKGPAPRPSADIPVDPLAHALKELSESVRDMIQMHGDRLSALEARVFHVEQKMGIACSCDREYVCPLHEKDAFE
jgi:hypothetical protein